MRPNPNTKKKKNLKRMYADSQRLSESSNYPSSTATGNHSHSVILMGAVKVEMYTSLIEPACPTIDSDVSDIEDLQHRAIEVTTECVVITGSAILACTKLPDGRIRVVLLQT